MCLVPYAIIVNTVWILFIIWLSPIFTPSHKSYLLIGYEPQADSLNTTLNKYCSYLLMLTVNRKLLEFFVQIPKLEIDGSNWIIFKDHFAFAAAAADLEKHIDGMGTPPNPPIFTWIGPTPFTSDQITEYEEYQVKQSKWLMGEAVIKQAIATTIPDSLFIEVCKKVMACLMWEAVRLKREKKSRMVTVDLRHKL